MLQFFVDLLFYQAKLIIFDTHNLQTFKYNAIINELLLMQFLLIEYSS